ncbi:sigma-E processing peptidase SpoIIGA [Tissierella carlieri]|uniref:Sporulation sigma-E factor-processing peptidase n=1 Tax=Tissierella carlieri TaxID=689904 RepID=A0ABT1SBX5_9FIRM|nr:sigma-E processing peptidase SpoIIGA [Tissierella carlieri]MCQ4923857.1 sigma-E processing peptidase SpoIIGA [Tissierella carlieri]
MYIIAEYLFIENFIINYAILQSTKIITRTKTTKGRIFITSTITALYPFALFFPSLSFLANFYMKIVISFIIVKLAYNSKSLILYIKQLSAFYVISFIFAGASIGIYYFTNNYYNVLFEPDYLGGRFPIKYIILGVVLGGIMIKNMVHYYQEKLSKEKELLSVTVHLNNEKSSFTALTDTGNSLIEPLSKLPVFVVEYEVINNLLPEFIRETFEENKEDDFTVLEKIMEALKEEIIIRIIPFKSVGSKNGILIGFKPDYITISNGDFIATHDDLLIGIFNGKLSADNQYNGLLNLRILNRGDLCVNEN